MNLSNNKRSLIYFMSFILLIVTVSCEKKGQVGYPVSKNYGENILILEKDSLTPGKSYSMEVELSRKSEVEIIITNLGTQDEPSVVTTKWKYDYIEGWVLDNYVNGKQSFRSTKRGLSDLKIVFQGTQGSIRIEYFENGELTNTKIFNY